MDNTEKKTDDMKETGGPAPNGEIVWDQDGMDLRPYAAIHLRIPDSGMAWLDEMIAKAEGRDMSVRVFQTVYAQGIGWHQIYKNVDDVVAVMLKVRE